MFKIGAKRNAEKEEKKIAELRNYVNNTMAPAVQNGNITDPEFISMNEQLNIMILGIIFTAKFEEDKKGNWKMISDGSQIPSQKTVGELCQIVSDWQQFVVPFLTGADATAGEQDDMSIPEIPADKCQVKDLKTKGWVSKKLVAKTYINGYDIPGFNLTVKNVLELLEVATAYQKTRKIKKAIVIGTIVIAAAAGGGIVLYKNHKNKADDDTTTTDTDVPDVDVDDVDVPDVDVDDADVPEVTLDEE